MPYQTDLAEALRDWGLPVVEVNGWRTRGTSSFNPGGAVNHHTAGARRRSIPSLRILIDGRPDLPGPLCNVGQSRSTEYNTKAKFDDVYLIAAGRANHAGSGGWNGLRGNSSVLGLEIEHVGNRLYEPWPERRQHTAHRIHAAFAEVGGYGSSMIAQHAEWTPRKIDFIDENGPAFRASVAATINSKRPPNNTEEEEDMKLAWFTGDSGTHAYLIAGREAVHILREELNQHLWFQTPWVGSPEKSKAAITEPYWRALRVLSGPYKNT